MQQFWTTLQTRHSELFSALWVHLQLSLVALLVASAIAIPLAIWVTKRRRVAEFILQVTSVLQTIPSLALLGLLIPLVGIGSAPALIALIVYALLPIFQNTYVGLTSIDPALLEAADALGFSKWRRLRKVELPLALPIIISGIRTALVLIVGTATLAALIGAGGLGNFILLGIDRNNTSLILIGAISAALLAIILSLIIKRLERAKPRTVVISIVTLLVLIGGASGVQAYQSRAETPIVIAGKLGSEPEILINMYADLIKEDPKAQVILKPSFGKTTFLFNALKHKQIDIYPEFSGTVLESLVKNPVTGQHLTAQATYAQAKALIQKEDKMTLLKPMAYNNTYAMAVRQSDAKKYNLQTIGDLTHFPNIKAGMTLEFIDLNNGLKGVNKVYGLNIKAKAMDPQLRYEAINAGEVNLVDAYSTDSQLKQYNLVILKDNKGVFPPYQGAPLMTDAFAQAHPAVVKALNRLAGKISETDMQAMNYAVNSQHKQPSVVAHQYLTTHHLLAK
ncbi:ABC transporter permease/substrate-binding protein [Periweissella cryptocerci]|uniref:ABC transporter permease/substrate-binding protein n=1 Tax=Periweissella cryptocerci TaxID=2506420 RepID=A0A4P6YU62_9LACO|nr:ABC transporter permease/substrate-binding protein [Periweissella cryptocerci]QBO36308.1 ABC transporter permease/substrate-binding protein [Periweissella cryptocerci]